MTPKTSGPAQRIGAARARECQKLAACDIPRNTTSSDSLQALRSAWLMRRLPLSAGMAAAVAAAYFEGGVR